LQIKWNYKRKKSGACLPVPGANLQYYMYGLKQHTQDYPTKFIQIFSDLATSLNDILLNIIHGEEELGFQVTTILRNIYLKSKSPFLLPLTQLEVSFCCHIACLLAMSVSYTPTVC
jgi:hypothetical protein